MCSDLTLSFSSLSPRQICWVHTLPMTQRENLKLRSETHFSLKCDTSFENCEPHILHQHDFPNFGGVDMKPSSQDGALHIEVGAPRTAARARHSRALTGASRTLPNTAHTMLGHLLDCGTPTCEMNPSATHARTVRSV